MSTQTRRSEIEGANAKPQRISLLAVLDQFFFVFAGLAAVWLAWLLLRESFQLGWWGILVFVVFWGMLAYLARSDRRFWLPAVGTGLLGALAAGILHDWAQAAIVAGVVLGFFAVASRRTTPVLLLPPLQWYGKISYSLYIGHLIPSTIAMHLLIPLVGLLIVHFVRRLRSGAYRLPIPEPAIVRGG